MVVIGGGYIGLELGRVWARLGAKVIVLEAMDRILPGLDGELGQLAHRTFAKQGLDFRTGVWVEGARLKGAGVSYAVKGWRPLRVMGPPGDRPRPKQS